MNKLNSIQIAKIKDVLEKAKTMKDADLESLRCNISSSNGNIKVKELILEGIDSIINKEKIINSARIGDADLKDGESY